VVPFRPGAHATKPSGHSSVASAEGRPQPLLEQLPLPRPLDKMRFGVQFRCHGTGAANPIHADRHRQKSGRMLPRQKCGPAWRAFRRTPHLHHIGRAARSCARPRSHRERMDAHRYPPSTAAPLFAEAVARKEFRRPLVGYRHIQGCPPNFVYHPPAASITLARPPLRPQLSEIPDIGMILAEMDRRGRPPPPSSRRPQLIASLDAAGTVGTPSRPRLQLRPSQKMAQAKPDRFFRSRPARCRMALAAARARTRRGSIGAYAGSHSVQPGVMASIAMSPASSRYSRLRRLDVPLFHASRRMRATLTPPCQLPPVESLVLPMETATAGARLFALPRVPSDSGASSRPRSCRRLPAYHPSAA